MVDEVKKLQEHILEQHDELQEALTANKKAVAEKLGMVGDGTLAGGAATVGQTVGGAVGGVIGGVASTGADVVGGVGTVADTVHNEIDMFFHNLRGRLGI
jgi:hypothetical protein